MKTKKVKAPVRVDFAGGTTDIEPFYSKHGGAVLNCAIKRYVTGEITSTDKKIKLSYEGNVPTSSGLGTSGAMTLVWLALITKEKDKKKLCEWVYNMSQARELFDDGKQDQYAAAYGGINLMEISQKGVVKVSKVKIRPKVLKELESKLVLVYSGKPHYSGDSNGASIRNLKKGVALKHFKRVKEIAYEMHQALEKGDLDLFAELMNEETIERSKFAKGIVGPTLKKVIDSGFKNGAIGAKVCGSGGGGSILFYGDVVRLKKKFGKKIIDFKFDFDGLKSL